MNDELLKTILKGKMRLQDRVNMLGHAAVNADKMILKIEAKLNAVQKIEVDDIQELLELLTSLQNAATWAKEGLEQAIPMIEKI